MNSHVILQSRPGNDGEPSVDNFRCVECPSPSTEPATGEILVRTCYLSVDPAMRCQMNEETGAGYLSAWKLGERVVGLCGMGQVEASACPGWEAGDLLLGLLTWPWARHFTIGEDSIDKYQKLDRAVFASRPSLALGSIPGVTVLIGLREKGHLPVDTLVVSGAAGACGSIAGQLGRLQGAKNVVGICGSEAKCKWITDDLGFSHAINYKSENVGERLRALCPRGVQTYFDNVGGEVSDQVIAQMSPDSHVVLCGQISQYNKDVPYPPPLPEQTQQNLKDKNITRDRFTVVNYPDQIDAAFKELVGLILSGQLKYRETVARGLAEAPAAFVSMMKGGNLGKQVVWVSDAS